MITRTEKLKIEDAISTISLMEEAGWAVRTFAITQWFAYVVFEREVNSP